MANQDSVSVTEAGWAERQMRTKRARLINVLTASLVVAAMTFPALLLASSTAHGTNRYLIVMAFAAWLFVLVLPYLGLRFITAQQDNDDRLVGRLTRRQEFESRLANALDMAEGEPEVIDVIERSFSSTLPDSPVELLLADDSHAHLLRMATASPSGMPPGCGVDSPDHCPAARRAQVQRFADSEDLDACPKLRGRPDGAVSALCVPVSIMGHSVGVIHTTGKPHAPLVENTVLDLGTLAKLAGTRIGVLRAMAETQLQAATDSLTGLMNRRSFEKRMSAVRREASVLSVAMADLDHFKDLNDTYGHDAGDRALRLFAEVLSESVRAQDLVCRHGGEEFVIALPGCTTDSARRILDGIRVRLGAAITVAALPVFTVSFGVIAAGYQEDLHALISRADSALYQAKHHGRDQVVVHDTSGNPVPATTGPEDGARHRQERPSESPPPPGLITPSAVEDLQQRRDHNRPRQDDPGKEPLSADR